ENHQCGDFPLARTSPIWLYPPHEQQPQREAIVQINPTSSIGEDWKACKVAYDDAVFFTGVSKGWADELTQGWRDHLAELAFAFKAKHGIEFDPKKPITVKEAA